MQDNFNLKDECIFVSLASYAHDIISFNDTNAFDGEALIMAKFIDKHFKRKTTRYSKTRVKRMTDYLENVIGPAFPDKINASVIMVATINYLLKETNHTESKIVFAPFKNKVSNIVNKLENSEYKDEIKKANKTLVNMLNETPSNFKSSASLEEAHRVHYSMIFVLNDIVENLSFESQRHMKPLGKLYELLNSFKDKLPNDNLLEIDFSLLKDNYNFYMLYAVLERLKRIVNKNIPIEKFSKINIGYLVPDNNKVSECKLILDKIFK